LGQQFMLLGEKGRLERGETDGHPLKKTLFILTSVKMVAYKCLRFGHWLTLCTLNIQILTYLLICTDMLLIITSTGDMFLVIFTSMTLNDFKLQI